MLDDIDTRTAATGAEAGTASRQQNVLMLGCGKMGGALLQRWSARTPFNFTAVSPSRRPGLPDGVVLAGSADELAADDFDVLVIAVKPQMIDEVLPLYLQCLRTDGLLVSVAAGTSCAAIARMAPRHDVIRVMPNLPVAIGQGVSAVHAPPTTTPEHRHLVRALMAPTGRMLWTHTEDELDRITAIAGSGPGFAFELIRGWSDAAAELGFDEEDARRWVLETLRGSVDFALGREQPPADLRDEVTSRNGTTAAGLAVLNGDGELDRRLRRTLRAAYDRAAELR
jgi:pyrroline-5-carboxylate reductase